MQVAPWQIKLKGNQGVQGEALLTGLGHGAYCVGCCWMLMALLFAGGVMNLFWVAGLGALVLAEKLLPQGLAVVYLVAGALVLTGIFMIVC